MTFRAVDRLQQTFLGLALAFMLPFVAAFVPALLLTVAAAAARREA